MPIPETQLDTWSHQGSITQSAATYNNIKDVLEASTTPYYEKTFKVFLQGSYGNDTNIYAESDVDIVIRLDSIYYSDISELSEDDTAAFNAARSPATYTLDEFKKDVTAVLTAKYGTDVTPGAKAIAIAAKGNRRKADVIVAAEFRRYFRFKSTYDERYVAGVCFFNSSGDRIANYPKQHSENLTSRHQARANMLKPMVRIMKNLRSKLVTDGTLATGVAPSYYVEGLFYNAPANLFDSRSYRTTLYNLLHWYQGLDDKAKKELLCANEQYYLLRDNAHTCWPAKNCEAFMSAAIKLWNNW